MYICFKCNNTFEEPEEYCGEDLEHFGFPCRENYYGSPCCGEVFGTTWECDCCGEWIKNDYIKIKNGNRICSDCYIENCINEG